jgi:hypothetical protein
LFAVYVFQELPTFDQRTTSPIEGEKAVIKNKGNCRQEQITGLLIVQRIFYTTAKREQQKTHQYNLTSAPTWSNSAWSQKLTGKGEGLLLQLLKISCK